MLVLGAILIFSCESELPPESMQPCLLTQIASSDESFEINVYYDSLNQIESVAREIRGDDHTYSYLTEFEYQEDKLEQVRFIDNGVMREEKLEIQYENNQMKKWMVQTEQEVRLFYQGVKITKLEVWNSCEANGPMCLGSTIAIAYLGDNVQKISSSYESMANPYTLVNTYSYDDKKNPFYNNLPLFLGSEMEDFSLLLSKNNVISISSVSSSGDDFTDVVQHEYNALDFPVTTTVDSGTTLMSYQHCPSN